MRWSDEARPRPSPAIRGPMHPADLLAWLAKTLKTKNFGHRSAFSKTSEGMGGQAKPERGELAEARRKLKSQFPLPHCGRTGGAKIIDLSHRIFKNFFTTVQKIGFFEEACRFQCQRMYKLLQPRGLCF